MILTVGPGEDLLLEGTGVPAVMIVLEGSGTIDGVMVRPGRSYYWPADAPALLFKVNETRRGPLKVAVAHKNQHIDRPTSYKREGGYSSLAGSRGISVPSSPLPYMGLQHGIQSVSPALSTPTLDHSFGNVGL
jgi:mannose-6-phosphate isomerase